MSTQDMTVFQDPNAGELAPQFQALVASEGISHELGDGIGGGYAILSIRGGKFRVKHNGEETPLLNEKDEPVGSVEAVIVKSNPYLTKQYYEKAFAEGDSAAPSCFSVDGKVPSAAVESPQHTNCSTCPMNRFGSRITEAGTKVKACQDNKKLAISPLSDLENVAFGGPMLFRVPASALKDLLAFSNGMSARGFPYYAVAVRIGLDIDVSYPKPTFKAMRPLTAEEAAIIVEQRSSDQVDRLLADFSDVKSPDVVIPPGGEFEQEPDAQPAPAAVAKPVLPPVVKPAPVAAAKPVAPKATVTKLVTPTKPVPAPQTPAPPPARAAKPAVKPAPAPAPAPVEAAPEASAEAEGATSEGDLNADIASILDELNATAS